jgi:hypothetical protein
MRSSFCLHQQLSALLVSEEPCRLRLRRLLPHQVLFYPFLAVARANNLTRRHARIILKIFQGHACSWHLNYLRDIFSVQHRQGEPKRGTSDSESGVCGNRLIGALFILLVPPLQEI